MNRIGSPAGLAIGSFRPSRWQTWPLVAFRQNHRLEWPKIEKSGSFCVNILSAEQEPICRTFATKGGEQVARALLDAGAPARRCLTVSSLGSTATLNRRATGLWPRFHCHWPGSRARGRPAHPPVAVLSGYGRFTPASLAAWESDLALQVRSADLARPEMEAVADQLGVEIVASTVAGDQMVLIATANKSAPSSDAPINMGQRIPFAPPLGTVFVAWASPHAQKAWLDRLGRDPYLERAAILATLAEIRKHGYSVGRGRAWHTDVRQALSNGTPGSSCRMTPSCIRSLHWWSALCPPISSRRAGGSGGVQTINTPGLRA